MNKHEEHLKTSKNDKDKGLWESKAVSETFIKLGYDTEKDPFASESAGHYNTVYTIMRTKSVNIRAFFEGVNYKKVMPALDMFKTELRQLSTTKDIWLVLVFEPTKHIVDALDKWIDPKGGGLNLYSWVDSKDLQTEGQVEQKEIKIRDNNIYDESEKVYAKVWMEGRVTSMKGKTPNRILYTLVQILPTDIMFFYERLANYCNENFHGHHLAYSSDHALEVTEHRFLEKKKDKKGKDQMHNFPNSVIVINGPRDGKELFKCFQKPKPFGDLFICEHKFEIQYFKKPESTTDMYKRKAEKVVPSSANGIYKEQKFVFAKRDGLVNHFEADCRLVAETQEQRNNFCLELNRATNRECNASNGKCSVVKK